MLSRQKNGVEFCQKLLGAIAGPWGEEGASDRPEYHGKVKQETH